MKDILDNRENLKGIKYEAISLDTKFILKYCTIVSFCCKILMYK